MKITILTLFPDMFAGFMTQSIIKRALAKAVVDISLVDIRAYTADKYGRVDTPPIGGGAGLVMKAQPIVAALDQTTSSHAHKVLLSPRGGVLTQETAKRLAGYPELVFVCGHYEGVDERIEGYVDESLSIGDYVLTGGEVAAMVVADAVIRLIPGAIEAASLEEESFSLGLLEYPQYTEPFDFKGATVPDILYSGNHEAIAKWRHLMRLVITRKDRPELFAAYHLTKGDIQLLRDYDAGVTPKWWRDALTKGQKFLKDKKP